jgi:hypothetical protein
MNVLYIIVICVLVLVLAFAFRPNHEYYAAKTAAEPVTVPIVYGAGFCRYCTQQKDELDAANIDYKYYDCTLPENKETCKDIKSYPTIKFPNSPELKVGKQPIELFAAYVKK